MFEFVLACGWALTAALVAPAWTGRRPGRGLAAGVPLGIVAGTLWPITLWIAVGVLVQDRAARRAAAGAPTPQAIRARVQEAAAFARQAELEGMPSSAAYWRAEVERLAAQRQSVAVPGARPPAAIVLGCTAASVATLGLVAVIAPAFAPASAPAGGPVVSVALPALPPPGEQPDGAPRTPLGNIATGYGQAVAFGGTPQAPVAEFAVGPPRPARCNAYAPPPQNGRFVEVPVTVRTHDDPQDTLADLTFGSWEFVAVDGRSAEASTAAAAGCGVEVPLRLGPNRTYEFGVVLDVRAEPGVLVLRSAVGRGGWEWPYTG